MFKNVLKFKLCYFLTRGQFYSPKHKICKHMYIYAGKTKVFFHFSALDFREKSITVGILSRILAVYLCLNSLISGILSKSVLNVKAANLLMYWKK